MTTAHRTITTAATILLALGFATPSFSQASDADGYGDGYQSGAYGRVRAADGDPTIVRADAERGETERAGVNAPVFPGDSVRTDRDQRLEIQLAGGTIVRVDRDAAVVFQSLPNPSAKYQDNAVLALNDGVLRVSSRLADKEEFRIDTHDASIYLLGEGEFRIDADGRNGTRVASLRGVAEVVGNDASVLVRGGMRTVTRLGSAPDQPTAYSAFASDGFDRWCDARDDAYRAHDRYASNEGDRRDTVPDEVQPYYSELSRNGTWTTVADYGTVWSPSGVSDDWRPYADGYWAYGPGGYFWVSNEPWGWAPYHYGNWQFVARRGWCWVPGRVFAGAWVSWSWGSLYVGWAPLDYWGRPGWVGGPYYAGYYDPGCWTFVNYSHIHADNLRRYAVPIGTVRDDLRHATVVARAPRIDPRRIAVSEEWRARAWRQVAEDRAAHMSPIQSVGHPDRRLADVEEHMMRRPLQASPSFDRRTVAPRERRILEDPNAHVRRETRPEAQDGVRDLYQRMSRPRETRATAPAPRPEASQSRPHAEAPRMPAPRAQAPQQTQPQRHPAPQQQAARPEPPRAHAPAQARPRHGDKN